MEVSEYEFSLSLRAMILSDNRHANKNQNSISSMFLKKTQK